MSDRDPAGASPAKPASAWQQLRASLDRPPAPAREMPYPRIRNFVLDVMTAGRRKNTVNVMLQADVTEVLRHLARNAADEATRVSITAFMASALAKTIRAHPHVNAYRKGSGKLVVFDEVDLNFTVEREVDGALLPVPFIVRSAETKSATDIHRELQAAKVAPVGETGPMSALEKAFFLMPDFARRVVWFLMRRDPFLFKLMAGTVGVTSIGMYTDGGIIGIPITPMTLTLTIGGIEARLALVDGMPVERSFIHLNLSVDHDIIDGAPLVRFADAFKRQLERDAAGAPQ